MGLIATVLPGFLIIQQGTLAHAMIGSALWAVMIGVGNVAGASLALPLFPVAIRYTATAFALNMTGAVFAGTGPYVSAWLVNSTGNVTAPALYLTILAAVGLGVALFSLPRRSAAQPRKAPAATV